VVFFVSCCNHDINSYKLSTAVLIVPDRVLGSYPDPGRQGTSPGKVCEGETGQASQAPVQAEAGKGSSRDPAAMEET
jgi:hypothetical protein